MQSSAQYATRDPRAGATSATSREIATGVSRSLPNASFAFTRASLIACIPLVAFAIFLQKFSSSLSGISTQRGRAVTERCGGCVLPCVERRCVGDRGSHTVITPGFPRTSRGLSRENYRCENTAPATSSTIPGRPCALTRSRVRPEAAARCRFCPPARNHSLVRAARTPGRQLTMLFSVNFNHQRTRVVIPMIFFRLTEVDRCGSRKARSTRGREIRKIARFNSR